jgi:hypothetical protein
MSWLYTVVIMFEVDEWWAGLTEAERELALRHRDDDPLHAEVVRQLYTPGAMWGDPARNGRGVERWHWAPAVRDFLVGGCE